MVKKVQSTCNFCAIDCNLDFYVEDGRIIRTVPTKGYPVNDGFSCIKGLSLSKQQTTVKPNALPKIRQADGSFKEVSWDEGFRHVADKIKELQDKYGRESVAGISTGQLTLEEFAIFGHVMRNFLQTNVDGNTRLCMASAVLSSMRFSIHMPSSAREKSEIAQRAQRIIFFISFSDYSD